MHAATFNAAVYMSNFAMRCLRLPHRLQWHTSQAGALMLQIAIKARVHLRCRIGAGSRSGNLHSMRIYMSVCRWTLQLCGSKHANPCTELTAKPESSNA